MYVYLVKHFYTTLLYFEEKSSMQNFQPKKWKIKYIKLF